jgi:hypothetical protein
MSRSTVKDRLLEATIQGAASRSYQSIGIINLSSFWWLNSLSKTGFRQLITAKGLFDMDPSLKASALSKGMQDVYNKRGIICSGLSVLSLTD